MGGTLVIDADFRGMTMLGIYRLYPREPGNWRSLRENEHIVGIYMFLP